MINKVSEVNKRIRLYKACSYILRTKLAAANPSTLRSTVTRLHNKFAPYSSYMFMASLPLALLGMSPMMIGAMKASKQNNAVNQQAEVNNNIVNNEQPSV